MKRISILLIVFTLIVNLSFPYISSAQSSPEQESVQERFNFDQLDSEFSIETFNECLVEHYDRDYDELKEDGFFEVALDEEDEAILFECLQTLANEFDQDVESFLDRLVEEATEEPTDEGSEEATEEPTDEGSEEATEEPTEEGTEEATEEPTEEGTEEATEEPTEEGSEEATEEPTEEGSEEATEEPTEEGSEEATEEPTEEESEEADDENHSVQTFSMQVSKESATSMLGHINGNGKVYRNIGDQNSVSTARLLNAVYYIKKKATYQDETYYQLSTHHTGTTGVVGWAKASDLSVRSHVLDNRNQQSLQVKGSGSAYSKAWGGSQDLVYSLSAHKGKVFNVNLTEKVGDNVWHRGTIDGKQVWIHSIHVEKLTITYKDTSKLGHINRTATIYRELGDQQSIATTNLLNAVYYIKKEAKFQGSTYYQLSRHHTGTSGIVGWAKASDLSVQNHVLENRNARNLQVKGSGNAYSKAWGGSRDLVQSLSNQKGKTFRVNLTEKVGNNVWYRGTIDGKQMWIHSIHVEPLQVVERNTSRLGHLNRNANVYKNIGDQNTISTLNLLNAVYYIKREATFQGQTYYLLSRQPSATNGIVGWARASDLSTQTHVGVNKNTQTLLITGTGNAYTKAWGGSQDLVQSLSDHKGAAFEVHLTERVGNSLWYRGMLNGKQMWIHSPHVTEQPVTTINYTPYHMTLREAVDRQFGPYAVTDQYPQYVSQDLVSYSSANGGYYYVNTAVLNVRSGPGTSYPVVDQLRQGQRLSVRRSTNGWYQLFWVNAKKEDINYYMNPENFVNNERQQFQFLDLTKSSGVTASILNNYLSGRGTLSNQGQAFIDAGRIHGINDIYLLSHALLETGHGTSTLARGNEYNGKTVYNMYGIGAIDSCPIECGTKFAYDQGWDTPYKAIVGGASFIGNNYVKSGQNTLYKMRWNPQALANNGRPTHQYATDIGWASKQVHTMYNLYQEIGSYSLVLDVPEYR